MSASHRGAVVNAVLRFLAPGPGYAGLVWPLSTAQLVSWGSLYYAFTLMLEPMERDLGVSRTELTGALMVGLLVAGACAIPVGALVDKGHARTVMTTGSLLAAAMLCAWSRVDTATEFLVIWVGLGIAFAATLYEPAFAVLVRGLGPLGRRAIAATTLLGGLASTVFIPLTHLLIDQFGWRDALIGLALCNLLITAPIHFICLRQSTARDPTRAPTASAVGPALRAAMARPAFWLLTISFTGGAFAVSGIVFHIVPLLSGRGEDLAVVVSAIALFGPAQVAGRVLLATFAADANLVVSGVVALGPQVLAFAVLLSGHGGFWPIAFFAILLGLGNGVLTIVRAGAVAALLGDGGFGAINGAVMVPVIIARATAPAAIAALWALGGGAGGDYGPALWLLLAMTVMALVCYLAGVTLARR